MVRNGNKMKLASMIAAVVFASTPAALAGARLGAKGAAELIPGRPGPTGVVRTVHSTNPLVVGESFYEGENCWSRIVPTRPDWKEGCSGSTGLNEEPQEATGSGFVAPSDHSQTGLRRGSAGPFARR